MMKTNDRKLEINVPETIRVPYLNVRIRTKKPLTFVPEFEKTDDYTGDSYYSIVDKNLNIHAIGYDQKELFENLVDEIAFNWHVYVESDQKNVDKYNEESKRIRNMMLEHFELDQK